MNFSEFLIRAWREERKSLALIVAMMSAIALIEAFKILLVLPLLEFIVKGQMQMSSAGIGILNKMMNLLQWVSSLFHLKLTLGFTLVFFVSVYFLNALLVIILNHFMFKLRLNYTYKLAQKVITNCFASRWAFFINNKPGKLVNILSVEAMRAGTAFQYLCFTISASFIAIMYLILAILISWQLTLFISLIAPFIFIFLRKITRLSQKNGASITQVNNQLQAEALENILAAKMLKSSSSESRQINYIGEIVKKSNHYYYLNYMCDALLSSLQEPIGTFILAMVIYISLSFLKLDPKIMLVTLIIFFRLTPRFYEAQKNYQVALSYLPALQEVDNLIETTERMKEESGSRIFNQLEQGVVFKCVHYSYDKKKSVLNGINLEILKGQSIGIVGESGSGKTTIADMILGLIRPDKGDILLDGISLSEYNLSLWRSHIGYVTQETHLFHDTVIQNLRWNKPNATEEEIISAAKLANAHDFILQMPNGYQSVIGDRGYRLSGGQRQRLALARVILPDPQIYIFDEATSSLDSDSEKYIQQSIDSLSNTKTTLVISHRISTLRNVDKIYVLDNNTIVESGAWDELMDKNGIFRRLAKTQDL